MTILQNKGRTMTTTNPAAVVVSDVSGHDDFDAVRLLTEGKVDTHVPALP